MAKEREKQTAYLLYVVQCRQANEVAALCKVQPKTVGEWIKKGKWKEERNARLNSNKNQAERIKEVIDNLSERSIAIFKEIDTAKILKDQVAIFTLNKEAVAIGQQVAMYNKVLLSVDKDAKVSLSVYLNVMEMIFTDLQMYDNKIYMQTLDFQAQHINMASVKFG